MDSEIGQLKKRITDAVSSVDTAALSSRKKELNAKTIESDFWKNQQEASSIMKEIGIIDETLDSINDLTSSADTLSEYASLVGTSMTEENEKEIRAEIDALSEKLSAFELRQFLSGPYDQNDAIISIHAGQGGTEANDWAEMLMRMYLRYFESKSWKADIMHMLKGDEAGISTATIEVEGLFAYGYLKGEKGTHRLVRLSPFNAQNLRQTSFAGIEVLPIIEASGEKDIAIPPQDLEFKATRSGGPGGQHVNKTSSAVTLTHIPTGITVHSSTRRSQHQNRESAMKLLKAKLWEIEYERQQEERAKIKGEHKIAAWGNQIRNYVLHPYKLVKDLRTGVESSNPQSVLDGNLDEFIDAEVRQVV